MLLSLCVQNFRNLQALDVEHFEGFNWFVGENGAGKTSLLEAINTLFTTKSFRTHKPKVFISTGEEKSIISGRMKGWGVQEQAQIGISKSRSGETHYRCNGNTVSAGELLKFSMPIQVIAPELPNIFDADSQERRRFLDWGVFHVKHDYLDAWRVFNRVLKQRNTILKDRVVDRLLLRSMDRQWLQTALQLHTIRYEYWCSFVEFLKKGPLQKLEDILGFSANNEGETVLEFKYKQGWSVEKTLESALSDSLDSDLKLGFTQSGPHRADLQLYVDNLLAADVLSRGQKKVVQIWLKLMQAAHLLDAVGKKSVFLVDDIDAELDGDRLSWAYEQIRLCSTQVFATSTQDYQEIVKHYSVENSAMFHVKHGKIEKIPSNLS